MCKLVLVLPHSTHNFQITTCKHVQWCCHGLIRVIDPICLISKSLHDAANSNTRCKLKFKGCCRHWPGEAMNVQLEHVFVYSFTNELRKVVLDGKVIFFSCFSTFSRTHALPHANKCAISLFHMPYYTAALHLHTLANTNG